MNCKKPEEQKHNKGTPQITPACLRSRLERKLLSMGGSRVLWQGNDPQAQLIGVRGELFAQPVLMKRGEPNRCHANAADLWARAKDKYQLVTGYALTNSRWFSHSWVVDGKNLYETNKRFDRYFGAVLPPLLALKFWFENFFVKAYPSQETPPGFWEDRPGILEMVSQVAQMSRAELIRLLDGRITRPLRPTIGKR